MPSIIIEKLFPRECIWCWKAGAYLCSGCKQTILPHPEICPFCHKISKGFQVCFSCKKEWYSALEGVIIWFDYHNVMKKLILKVKFGHKRDVIDFLVGRLSLVVEMIQNPSFPHENPPALRASPFKEGGKNWIISFIPSHWRRKYLEKWYNQSELLAKNLANKLDLPMMAMAKKVKHTSSQLKLKKEERRLNLEWSFELLNLEWIANGSTVLLVDDVLTTGSTLLTLAKLIKSARPDLRIWGAVLARNMR